MSFRTRYAVHPPEHPRMVYMLIDTEPKLNIELVSEKNDPIKSIRFSVFRYYRVQLHFRWMPITVWTG